MTESGNICSNHTMNRGALQGNDADFDLKSGAAGLEMCYINAKHDSKRGKIAKQGSRRQKQDGETLMFVFFAEIQSIAVVWAL